MNRPRLQDEPMPQTTVRLPHDLLKRARIRAAVDEVTLQQLFIDAIRRELDRRDNRDARRSQGS